MCFFFAHHQSSVHFFHFFSPRRIAFRLALAIALWLWHVFQVQIKCFPIFVLASIPEIPNNTLGNEFNFFFRKKGDHLELC